MSFFDTVARAKALLRENGRVSRAAHFLQEQRPRQTSTITLSLHFLAPEAEIAAIGDAFRRDSGANPARCWRRPSGCVGFIEAACALAPHCNLAQQFYVCSQVPSEAQKCAIG